MTKRAHLGIVWMIKISWPRTDSFTSTLVSDKNTTKYRFAVKEQTLRTFKKIQIIYLKTFLKNVLFLKSKAAIHIQQLVDIESVITKEHFLPPLDS